MEYILGNKKNNVSK